MVAAYAKTKRPRQTTTKRKRRALGITVASTGFHFILKWDDDSINRNRRKLFHSRMVLEMTQKQLADRAGLCQSTIMHFEDVENTPQYAPRLFTWLRIIKALGGTVTVEAPNT